MKILSLGMIFSSVFVFSIIIVTRNKLVDRAAPTKVMRAGTSKFLQDWDKE